MITIIIILILAGITIGSLTGDNSIIDKAGEAKDATELAGAREKVEAEYIMCLERGKLNADKFKTNIQNSLGIEDKDIIDNGNGTWTIKFKGTDIITGDKERALAKDVLKIDPTATEAKDKSPYVRYNGMDCRVLYNDETHGLQIITAESIETVTLGYGDNTGANIQASDFTYSGSATIDDNFKKAAVSYNGAVDNLNNKAKTYMDSKGIATDARCLGSIPTLKNSKFQSDNSGMWSSMNYTYLTTYSWNNIFKTEDTNYTGDVQQLKNLGLNVSSGYTWLASRLVRSDSSATGYYGRHVYSSGSTSVDNLCGVYHSGWGSAEAPSFGFRPVFLLSSNVRISTGDGSSGSPYIIE